MRSSTLDYRHTKRGYPMKKILIDLDDERAAQLKQLAADERRSQKAQVEIWVEAQIDTEWAKKNCR